MRNLKVFFLACVLSILSTAVMAQATTPTASEPAAAMPAADGSPAQSTDTTAATASPPEALSLGAIDLSPWGMFMNADMVVKGVICGLAFASIITWTIWLAKTVELLTARRRVRQTIAVLADASSLHAAKDKIGAADSGCRRLLSAAIDEWKYSSDVLDDHDGLKERVALHLHRVEAMIGRRVNGGTGILATIGSTAPFVGLFGTVWGIMNSFIGISRSHTTNLAVVAPGIAEALLATAIGLVAAIPAVIIYNHFARQIAAYKALVADASSSVLRLCSRDLSRRSSGRTASQMMAV